jgi:hypothetical protein
MAGRGQHLAAVAVSCVHVSVLGNTSIQRNDTAVCLMKSVACSIANDFVQRIECKLEYTNYEQVSLLQSHYGSRCSHL